MTQSPRAVIPKLSAHQTQEFFQNHMPEFHNQ